MAPDKTVIAAAIQWDIERGDFAHNLEQAESLLEEAKEEGAEVVVLPELWASSFMGEDASKAREAATRADERAREISGDLGLLIVGSNYEFAADGTVYNRATLVEHGNVLGEYRKIHLFTPQGEDRHFAHGERPLVVDTGIGRVAVAICYDLRFPELIRHLYIEGAETLLLPAQWPEPRENHWRILVRARAVENQWFVVATNRCGIEPSVVTGQDISFPGNSLIVDPTGTILAEGNGTPGVFAAELELKQITIVRRAIPVGKDRQDAIYDRFKSKV